MATAAKFGLIAVAALAGAAVSGQEPDLIARARAIHERVITLDTHNDVEPNNFTRGCNYTMPLTTQVNLPKMKAGGLDVSFMIVYVGQSSPPQVADAFQPAGYDRAYKSAIAMFEDYPIVGVGFAAFGEMWERYPQRYQKEYKEESSVSSPHSSFLSLISETGAIGITCFGIFFFQIFRSSLRVARHAPSVAYREYAGFVLSATAAYLVGGLGLHLIRNIDFPNRYLFLFLGILSGMVDQLASLKNSPHSRFAQSALALPGGEPDRKRTDE